MDLRVLYVGLMIIQSIYGQFQQPPQQNFQQNGGFNNRQMPPQNTGFNNQQMPPQNTGFNQQQPPNTRFQQPPSNGNQQPSPNTGMQQPTKSSNPGMQQPNPTQAGGNMNGAAVNTAAGMSPEQNSQMTCATAGRMAVAQCFQSNGGFQMMTVIALLSNGTQGQLPPNPDQVKQTLCRSQRQIVPCIFDGIRKYNGSQECNSISAFIRLEQETVGLMNSVQQLCGTGLLPKISDCMRTINYDMLECYAKVGLNPELYTPEGSRMEGAVIGDNREVAKMFCSKRRELFACQTSVLDACPNVKKLQALSGHDQLSMQNGMDVLCKDVNVYIKGLVCFQTPTEEVQTCATRLITQMTRVTMEQIRENLPQDGFFREYCKVRIDNLKCDSGAWANTCEDVAVGLKNEFQCNLLPSFCKNDSATLGAYNEACAETTFQRALRNTDSGADSIMTSSLATILFTVSSIAMFLL